MLLSVPVMSFFFSFDRRFKMEFNNKRLFNIDSGMDLCGLNKLIGL